METSMFIPLWIKVLVLFLSALTLFTLAARELVAEWVMSAVKLFQLKPRRSMKRTSLDRQAPRAAKAA
jgi:hypothetical protein